VIRKPSPAFVFYVSIGVSILPILGIARVSAILTGKPHEAQR
jgi:hypothetical protein